MPNVNLHSRRDPAFDAVIQCYQVALSRVSWRCLMLPNPRGLVSRVAGKAF